jgi:hypothetical protein
LKLVGESLPFCGQHLDQSAGTSPVSAEELASISHAPKLYLRNTDTNITQWPVH